MFVIFFTTKTRMKSIVFFLVFFLLLGGLFFWKNPLKKTYIRVEPGVIFMNKDFGGSSREQIEEYFAVRLAEWQVNPVNAEYNSLENSIVPELWGYRINQLETVNKILSAQAGENVDPVFEPVMPQITMADYPAAVIRNGNPNKKQIALMINVAWGTEYLPFMLDIFAAEDVSATFFVVGKWAQDNMALLEEIYRRGHLLANHGHTDSVVYTELTAEEIQDGLEEVNRLIYEVTGERPLYFTPHKGEYNPLTLEIVSRQGMRTLLWSLDTVDWMEPGVQAMHERVTEKIHQGAIVLMHPTADTVQYLQEAVPVIKNKGYDVVTVQELLDPDYPPLSLSGR